MGIERLFKNTHTHTHNLELFNHKLLKFEIIWKELIMLWSDFSFVEQPVNLRWYEIFFLILSILLNLSVLLFNPK